MDCVIYNQLNYILKSVYGKSLAVDYRMPVCLEYPDLTENYLEVIKKPIDLCTLLLLINRYQKETNNVKPSVDSIVRVMSTCLRQIFINALQFNENVALMESYAKCMQYFTLNIWNEVLNLTMWNTPRSSFFSSNGELRVSSYLGLSKRLKVLLDAYMETHYSVESVIDVKNHVEDSSSIQNTVSDKQMNTSAMRVTMENNSIVRKNIVNMLHYNKIDYDRTHRTHFVYRDLLNYNEIRMLYQYFSMMYDILLNDVECNGYIDLSTLSGSDKSRYMDMLHEYLNQLSVYMKSDSVDSNASCENSEFFMKVSNISIEKLFKATDYNRFLELPRILINGVHIVTCHMLERISRGSELSAIWAKPMFVFYAQPPNKLNTNYWWPVIGLALITVTLPSKDSVDDTPPSKQLDVDKNDYWTNYFNMLTHINLSRIPADLKHELMKLVPKQLMLKPDGTITYSSSSNTNSTSTTSNSSNNYMLQINEIFKNLEESNFTAGLDGDDCLFEETISQFERNISHRVASNEDKLGDLTKNGHNPSEGCVKHTLVLVEYLNTHDYGWVKLDNCYPMCSDGSFPITMLPPTANTNIRMACGDKGMVECEEIVQWMKENTDFFHNPEHYRAIYAHSKHLQSIDAPQHSLLDPTCVKKINVTATRTSNGNGSSTGSEGAIGGTVPMEANSKGQEDEEDLTFSNVNTNPSVLSNAHVNALSLNATPTPVKWHDMCLADSDWHFNPNSAVPANLHVLKQPYPNMMVTINQDWAEAITTLNTNVYVHYPGTTTFYPQYSVVPNRNDKKRGSTGAVDDISTPNSNKKRKTEKLKNGSLSSIKSNSKSKSSVTELEAEDASESFSDDEFGVLMNCITDSTSNVETTPNKASNTLKNNNRNDKKKKDGDVDMSPMAANSVDANSSSHVVSYASNVKDASDMTNDQIKNLMFRRCFCPSRCPPCPVRVEVSNPINFNELPEDYYRQRALYYTEFITKFMKIVSPVEILEDHRGKQPKSLESIRRLYCNNVNSSSSASHSNISEMVSSLMKSSNGIITNHVNADLDKKELKKTRKESKSQNREYDSDANASSDSDSSLGSDGSFDSDCENDADMQSSLCRNGDYDVRISNAKLIKQEMEYTTYIKDAVFPVFKSTTTKCNSLDELEGSSIVSRKEENTMSHDGLVHTRIVNRCSELFHLEDINIDKRKQILKQQLDHIRKQTLELKENLRHNNCITVDKPIATTSTQKNDVDTGVVKNNKKTKNIKKGVPNESMCGEHVGNTLDVSNRGTETVASDDGVATATNKTSKKVSKIKNVIKMTEKDTDIMDSMEVVASDTTGA